MAFKLNDHESASNHHSDHASAQAKFDASRGAYFTAQNQRLQAVAQKHGVDPNNIHQYKAAFKEYRKQEKPHLEAQRNLEREIASGPRGGQYHTSASGKKVYER